MKSTSQHLLATVAVVAIGKSAALKSSVRGGANSDNADPISRVLPRRSLHHAVTSQQNERQTRDAPSYWWLDKQSSEKDIVYIPNDDEMQTAPSSLEDENAHTASSGKNSFSVFTIEVDSNPDTSGLPYRAPSKYPTARPTNAPTESSSPTVAIEEVAQFTEKLDASDRGTVYHYPIWADTFKGCTSSFTAPEAYMTNPSEYLFSSEVTCCDFWFDSQDCGSRVDRNGNMVMNYASNTDNVDEFGTMDEYMFRMNGIDAYSDGGATSEDYGSGDGAAPSPSPPTPSDVTYPPPTPSDVTYPPPTASVEASTFPTPSGQVTLPAIANATSTPTYLPTPFQGDSGGTDFNTTDLPAFGGNDNASVSSPPPTPGTVTTTDYTPYPTYADLPVATPPPVFEVSTSTNSPSATGTGTVTAPPVIMGTAPPVQNAFTPQPTSVGSSTGSGSPTPFGSTVGSGEETNDTTSSPPVMEGTPWPTFSDSFENPGAASTKPTSSGSASGTTAGTDEGTTAETTLASSGTNMTTLLAIFHEPQKSERTASDIYIFDEDSDEGGISPLLNLHDEDSSAGWEIIEVGGGIAFDGTFTLMASSQRIAGTSTSLAKRLFMSHAKRNVAVESGDAKMSVTIGTGAGGGILKFAVMSTVSFPLDVLEIGVDGGPVTSITEVSKDWQVLALELTPGEHTVYFSHIVNPMKLPQAEIDQIPHPDGYQGISQIDGMFYTEITSEDLQTSFPTMFPTVASE